MQPAHDGLPADDIFFFFQAEDGIRDGRVTGVQTCALPISLGAHVIQADAIGRELMSPGHAVYDEILRRFGPEVVRADGSLDRRLLADLAFRQRSEERRVGKECRSGWWPEHEKKNMVRQRVR